MCYVVLSNGLPALLVRFCVLLFREGNRLSHLQSNHVFFRRHVYFAVSLMKTSIEKQKKRDQATEAASSTSVNDLYGPVVGISYLAI
jgi:hypothetical protein